MTGDVKQFTSLEALNRGSVIFSDNGKGKIIGIGKVHITPSNSISNVLLVDGLKHNLLSISQFCDKGFQVVFKSSYYMISSPDLNEV